MENKNKAIIVNYNLLIYVIVNYLCLWNNKISKILVNYKVMFNMFKNV